MQVMDVSKISETALRVWWTDSEDDDNDGRHLRSVLAAAALRHCARRPPTVHLAVQVHPAGLDRLPLAVGEQLLLEPDRLLLDE